MTSIMLEDCCHKKSQELSVYIVNIVHHWCVFTYSVSAQLRRTIYSSYHRLCSWLQSYLLALYSRVQAWVVQYASSHHRRVTVIDIPGYIRYNYGCQWLGIPSYGASFNPIMNLLVCDKSIGFFVHFHCSIVPVLLAGFPKLIVQRVKLGHWTARWLSYLLAN